MSLPQPSLTVIASSIVNIVRNIYCVSVSYHSVYLYCASATQLLRFSYLDSLRVPLLPFSDLILYLGANIRNEICAMPVTGHHAASAKLIFGNSSIVQIREKYIFIIPLP